MLCTMLSGFYLKVINLQNTSRVTMHVVHYVIRFLPEIHKLTNTSRITMHVVHYVIGFLPESQNLTKYITRNDACCALCYQVFT